MELAAASTEYIRVPVSATDAGEPIDISGDSVRMGFTSVNGEAPTTWHLAEWETVGSTYNARCLVGPDSGGGPELERGSWAVWVKITDSPEVPVLRAGFLSVI